VEELVIDYHWNCPCQADEVDWPPAECMIRYTNRRFASLGDLTCHNLKDSATATLALLLASDSLLANSLTQVLNELLTLCMVDFPGSSRKIRVTIITSSLSVNQPSLGRKAPFRPCLLVCVGEGGR